MLHYVLQACYGAGCDHVLVVVGHGKEEVMAEFGDDKRIVWIEQTEQLGTGHAARMCEPWLRGHSHGDVFILAGDGPLIRAQVLQTLHQAHREEQAAASMATAILDDPSGYGRIIRDGDGRFIEIVEQIDCTPEQREIREVFPSYYCVKGDELLFALSRLKNENKKGEYYLTDVYSILRAAGKRVLAVQAVSAEDVLSINSREQQTQVDAIMQERIQRELLQAGITIVSTVNTYIEAGVSIGTDTVVRPFSFIGRDSTIGPECNIGPFACVPAESIVPEGTNIAGRAGEMFGGMS
jgi:bifunctional UDP-N-acetylglucosamine pyrophosphorylase / glucosamine-1-phosphate N-acetyltransferase